MSNDNHVYNLIKDKIPVKTCLKERNDNNFLIVSSNNLKIHYFNETAKDFYCLVDGNMTINKIISKLLRLYKVERNIITKDIISLIREMQWNELIALKGVINK